MDLKHSIDKKSDEYLYEKIKRCLVINLKRDCHLYLQGAEYTKNCIKKELAKYPWTENNDFNMEIIISSIVVSQLPTQSLTEIYKYKNHSTTIMPDLYELLLHPEDHLKEYIISKNKYLTEDATNNTTMFDSCIDRLLEELESNLLELDEEIASKKVETRQFTSHIMSIYESTLSNKEKFMKMCRLVCDIAIQTNENEDEPTDFLEKEVPENYDEYYTKVKSHLISQLNLCCDKKLKAPQYLKEKIANLMESYNKNKCMSSLCSQLKNYIVTYQSSSASSSLLDVYRGQEYFQSTAVWIVNLLQDPEIKIKKFVEKTLDYNSNSASNSNLKQIIDNCSKELYDELPYILDDLDKEIAYKNDKCMQILSKITKIMESESIGDELYRKIHNEIIGTVC
jgi:hypothetical protein